MNIESNNCKCSSEFPIVLQHQLSENSIVCSNCNLDKNLGITVDLKKEIVDWNQEYNRIYRHWLESNNPIEALSNPSSNLNVRGLQIISKLNAITPAYYWWNVEEGKTFNNCPKCREQLWIVNNKYTGTHKICDKCKILIND